jgi:hypothetical protein
MKRKRGNCQICGKRRMLRPACGEGVCAACDLRLAAGEAIKRKGEQ